MTTKIPKSADCPCLTSDDLCDNCRGYGRVYHGNPGSVMGVCLRAHSDGPIIGFREQKEVRA